MHVAHSKTVIGHSLGAVGELCFLATTDSVPAPTHSAPPSVRLQEWSCRCCLQDSSFREVGRDAEARGV